MNSLFLGEGPQAATAPALSLRSHHQWKGRSFRHFLSQHQGERRSWEEEQRLGGKRLHHTRPRPCFPMLRSSVHLCRERSRLRQGETFMDKDKTAQRWKTNSLVTPRASSQKPDRCAHSCWSIPLNNFFLIILVFVQCYVWRHYTISVHLPHIGKFLLHF